MSKLSPVKYDTFPQGLLKGTIIFLFWVHLSLAAFAAANHPAFPLQLSSNKQFLVDQQQQPFLIKEISAWGLIQALSEPDEKGFIDSVKKKGFNTLLVSIISADTRFAGNPPNWQGIPPFLHAGDFSSYNEAYFQHADRFLQMAKENDMLVLLVPCYLGYSGDKNQGWWDELLASSNSPEKSKAYGAFLGHRYKDVSNMIWVAGGDNTGKPPLQEHLTNIIEAIKQSDPGHLWTGHFDSSHGTNWASENQLYSKFIDVNGLYDFTESSLGADSPQYKTEIEKFGKGRMIFQLDQSYEHDIPHGPDNEDHQWIRRKNYDGLLSGCAGTSFSPGQTDNQCYVFTNWKPLMNTTGMLEVSYCFHFFDSMPWHELIPDRSEDIIVKGRGTFGSISFVCAAITNDHGLMIAYLPDAKALSIDLGKFKSTYIKASWFNPRNSTHALIGNFAAKGIREFQPTEPGDWVLTIEKTN